MTFRTEQIGRAARKTMPIERTDMISIPTRQFQKAAQFACASVERRSTIPVLQSLKATANGALSLEGTDLDTITRATLPYNGDEAEFLIPSPRKLLTATRKAKGETVDFEQDDVRLNVKSGDLKASLVAAIPADEFPAGNWIVEATLQATVGTDFIEALNRVRPAISKEETRYYLNGIFFHKVADWAYRLAATDGHRLFFADVMLPDATGEIDGKIIPRRAIEHIVNHFNKASEGIQIVFGRSTKSNAKDATLAPSTNTSRVSFETKVGEIGYGVQSKLIDGTFPDYSRVIPTETTHHLSVDRKQLKQAIDALTPLSTTRTRGVRIAGESGGIKVELQSPDVGNSQYRIEAEHNLPDDLMLGMNGLYLLDALAAFNGDEIRFDMTDAGSPVIITDPSDTAFKIVQMPMRV